MLLTGLNHQIVATRTAPRFLNLIIRPIFGLSQRVLSTVRALRQISMPDDSMLLFWFQPRLTPSTVHFVLLRPSLRLLFLSELVILATVAGNSEDPGATVFATIDFSVTCGAGQMIPAEDPQRALFGVWQVREDFELWIAFSVGLDVVAPGFDCCLAEAFGSCFASGHRLQGVEDPQFFLWNADGDEFTH